MPIKRTTTAVYASPARKPVLRARKRQKTAHSSLAQRLDSDGDDREAEERTDSDYEDCIEYERGLDQGSGSGVVGSRRRGRRRSAPADDSGTSSRAASSRRTSVAGPGGGARTRGAHRSGKEDGHGGVVQHSRSSRGAARTQQPLSPLPVNHAVERQQRAAMAKGKERARDEEDAEMRPLAPAPSRRTSAPPPQQQQQQQQRDGGRVTRRMSSGSVGPEPSVPTRRSRRASWATTECGSEDEQQLDMDEDRVGRGGSAELRAGRLRRRKPELEDISDAGEAADGEGGEEESPEASDAAEGNGAFLSFLHCTFHRSPDFAVVRPGRRRDEAAGMGRAPPRGAPQERARRPVPPRLSGHVLFAHCTAHKSRARAGHCRGTVPLTLGWVGRRGRGRGRRRRRRRSRLAAPSHVARRQSG